MISSNLLIFFSVVSNLLLTLFCEFLTSLGSIEIPFSSFFTVCISYLSMIIFPFDFINILISAIVKVLFDDSIIAVISGSVSND